MSHYDDDNFTEYRYNQKPRVRKLGDVYSIYKNKQKSSEGIEYKTSLNIELAFDIAISMQKIA